MNIKIPFNFQKLSLSNTISIPFVSLVIITALLIGWLSLNNGQKAVQQIAEQLREEISDRVLERLHHTLSQAPLINQMNAYLIAQGQLNTTDWTTWQIHFKNQMNVLDINSLFFISLTGDEIRVQKIAQSKTIKVTLQHRPELMSEIWYREALKRKEAHWVVMPYIPEATLKVVQAAYDTQGKLIGIIGSELDIHYLNQLMRHSRMGIAEDIFILDEDGEVISASSWQTVESKNFNDINLIVEKPIVIKVVKYVKNQIQKVGNVMNTAVLRFEEQNGTYFVQTVPLRDQLGLNWTVAIVITDANFMYPIILNTQFIIILCLLALMSAILVGIRISNWIVKPILHINVAAQSLAEGHWEEILPQGQRIHELDILVSSFNRMAKQLTNFFKDLQEFNQQLEKLVEIRTEELAHLVTQLEAAKQQAESASRAKSTFLAKMTHELRTPMNAILGFTQLLLSENNLHSSQKEKLETIHRSGKHLLALINEVLEMSKIEMGQVELVQTSFDLHYLLHNLKEMFYLKAIEKKLQLNFLIHPDVPYYIKSDERKLSQILINLLDNGLKFTPRGNVNLSVTPLVSSTENQNNKSVTLHFQVEDSGIGIPSIYISTLFTPFTQIERERQEQEGAGLGLSISYQFVRLLGGNLTLQSQVNKGSCFEFTLTFPLAEASEVPFNIPHEKVVGLVENAADYRILIVEDIYESRKVLVNLLENIGFNIQYAVNGKKAIEIFQTWQPHLICMDIRMPIMNGLEATRLIRAQANYSVVIVALTAGGFEHEKQAALAAGCDDFIVKPYQEAELLGKIAQYLGVHYRYAALETANNVHEYQELSETSVAINDEQLRDLIKKLPENMRKSLHLAAAQADSEWVLELAQQLMPQHAELVKMLTAMVGDFQFDQLVLFLKEESV